MADSVVTKKDVTFTFETGLTRKVSVGNFPDTEATSENVNAFRTKIKAFNDSDVSLVNSYYFSNPDDNGVVHAVTGISAANVTTTEKTVIYAKTESARIAALRYDDEGSGE